MKKNEPLPEPLLTPTTKAEKGGHDENVTRDELHRARPRRRARPSIALAEMCLELFAFGQKRAAERGLILVDTKYELGRTPDGKIVFIDEIHTPDSSRYWYADDYEARLASGEEPRALDKEYVRRWYVDQGYTGTGTPPPIPDERARRGGAPLHRRLRAGDRQELRPRHRRAERAHREEPGDQMMTARKVYVTLKRACSIRRGRRWRARSAGSASARSRTRASASTSSWSSPTASTTSTRALEADVREAARQHRHRRVPVSSCVT